MPTTLHGFVVTLKRRNKFNATTQYLVVSVCVSLFLSSQIWMLVNKCRWELCSSGFTTQRLVIISYLHFGPTYRIHLQGSRILNPEDGIDRFSRKNRYEITTTGCVITRKSAVLIYFAAEAWQTSSVLRHFPCHYFQENDKKNPRDCFRIVFIQLRNQRCL